MADRDDDAPPGPNNNTRYDDTPMQEESIGRGRPPKHTRWKKGQSGNPNGRPKDSKNVSTYIAQELKERVTITENGKRTRITKAQAYAKRLVNGAVSGEPKMMLMLVQHDRAQVGEQTGGSRAEMPLGPEDQLVLANVVSRIRAAEPAPDGGEPTAEESPAVGELTDEPSNPQE